MATIRNTETQDAKDFWQKVEQAADRAPAWVKERMDQAVPTDTAKATQSATVPQPEGNIAPTVRAI